MNRYTHRIVGRNGYTVFTGTRAQCVDYVQPGFGWRIVADPPAALIAAAPDMLARLESLLWDLDAIGYAQEDDEVSGAECVDVVSRHIERIRALIAKATGVTS